MLESDRRARCRAPINSRVWVPPGALRCLTAARTCSFTLGCSHYKFRKGQGWEYSSEGAKGAVDSTANRRRLAGRIPSLTGAPSPLNLPGDDSLLSLGI
jgi:hypothetical protein